MFIQTTQRSGCLQGKASTFISQFLKTLSISLAKGIEPTMPTLQSSAPLTELILLASKQGNLRQTVADQGGPDHPTPKRNTSDKSTNCRCSNT